MSFKKIFKIIVAIPFAVLAIFTFVLYEEAIFGIYNFAYSCESKIDFEKFRVCVQDSYGNDETDPPDKNIYASVSLGKRILPGVYRIIGGRGQNKFTFASHADAKLQVTMLVPPTAEILVDSNVVGRFKIPEDFADY
jgi:hypothetical protein